MTFLVLPDFYRQFRSVRMAYCIGERLTDSGIQKLQCFAAFRLFSKKGNLTSDQLCHLHQFGLQRRIGNRPHHRNIGKITNGAVPAFPQRVGILSQTIFCDGLDSSQQAVPQFIMDVHFCRKDLFIQIDFHDTVQQGFLTLLHLAEPNGVFVQFFAESVEFCNFRCLDLNGIEIKKSQFKTPDRAVGEAEEQLLVGASIYFVRIFRQPRLS